MSSNQLTEVSRLKLHINYMFLIFFLIIIFMFVFASFLWPYNEDLAQKVSFAGSVSSIILSVLAIIITLLGESKLEHVRGKITNSSEQLVNVTNDIKNASDNLQLIISKLEKVDKIERDLDNLSKMFAKPANEAVEDKRDNGEVTNDQIYKVLNHIFNFALNGKSNISSRKSFLLAVYTEFYYDKKEREILKEYLERIGYKNANVGEVISLALPFTHLRHIKEKELFKKDIMDKIKEFELEDIVNQPLECLE